MKTYYEVKSIFIFRYWFPKKENIKSIVIGTKEDKKRWNGRVFLSISRSDLYIQAKCKSSQYCGAHLKVTSKNKKGIYKSLYYFLKNIPVICESPDKQITYTYYKQESKAKLLARMLDMLDCYEDVWDD